MAGSSTILEEKLVDSVIVRKGSSLPHSWRSRYMPKAIWEVSGSERRGQREEVTEKNKSRRRENREKCKTRREQRQNIREHEWNG